jgi:hypothetical protein
MISARIKAMGKLIPGTPATFACVKLCSGMHVGHVSFPRAHEVRLVCG